MALDPNDPYYIAEDISPTIAAMEHPLCQACGVGLDHFGSKGNTVHTSGYHRSRNWILHSPDSAHGSGDYSIQLAADNGDHDDDVAAFDFSPGVWGSSDNRAKMKVLTQRLLTACQNHDPRVANLREFAGTLNGTSVITWDCSRNAFKSPFDSSHLDHIHGSIYRSRTRWDQAGIVAVMLGTTTQGDDMFLRTPSGSIYLAAGGKVIPVTLADWNATSPQTYVSVPQSLVTALVNAPSGPSAAEIAAQVVEQLPPGALDQATVEAGVLAVLTSVAGQAALVQAANTAEDS